MASQAPSVAALLFSAYMKHTLKLEKPEQAGLDQLQCAAG